MHSVLNIFTRKASILAFLSFVLLLTFIQQSCRKTDLGQTSLAKEEAFFRTASKDPNVLRLIASLKAQNERTGFVSKLPKNSGTPIWDKYVMRSKKLDKSIIWRGLNGEPDSVVVIPFTSNNENLSAIIVYDSSTVSPALDCYTTNGNLYAVCHNATVDIDKAEQMLAMFLQMENRVFGTTVFYHIPAKIFKNPALPDTATSEKMLVIDTVTVQGFAADDCFVIKYCNPGGVCTPPTYCDNCSVCPWVYYCDSPPPPGDGGGGGDPTPPPPTNPPPTGGGSGGNCTNCPPPPPEPCPFGGAWYNFVPTYEPCGPTNPPIPHTEPPLENQMLIDSLQGYPCAQGVLAALPSVNAKVKSIIHDVFNVNSDINILFKPALGFTKDSIDGYSLPPTGASPANWTGRVFLNPWLMQYSMKEYNLATMFHEALHCTIEYWRMMYRTHEIDSNQFKAMFPIFWNPTRPLSNTELQQHNEMANNYVTIMKDAIQSYNPNVPDSVALAISWAGLEQTTAWHNKSDTVASRRINWTARTDTAGTTSVAVYKLKKCP